MLLQSVAIGVKKFLVDHIITACVKEMSPGCCMQSFKQKKHFAFPKNVWYQHNTKFCVLSNLASFNELLIGQQPTFLECTVLL